MSDTQGEKALQFYREKFAKYGLDPRSLSWKTLGASHQRFRQIWKEIDFDDKSVLDVGCGFGEMARFLRKRYKNVKYKGIDIVSEFIEIDREKHPYYEFEVRDYFTDSTEEKYDIVMAVGVMNSNLGSEKENMEFRKEAIKKLYNNALEVAAFSMLGGHPKPATPEGSNVWYADSFEIKKFCETVCERVVLRDKYHPRDFSIFMYR